MNIDRRRWWSWPSAFALLFFSIPLLLFHAYPLSFWATTDYLPLGLADALNLAYRIGDRQMYSAVGMMDHPGVPFYFMSWLALALSGYPVATPGPGFFSAVVAHVDDYYQHAVLLGALVGAVSVYMFAHTARNLAPVGVVAAALLVWLVSTPATLSAFVSPSIDLFAILINSLFFAVLVRLAFDRDITTKVTIFSACVSAFAYLNKLPYISFSLALATAGVANLFLRGAGWDRGKRLSVIFTVMSLSVIAAVGGFIIGWSGFFRLLRFHANVFFHSGHYGAGNHLVASSAEIWLALAAIPADRAYAVFVGLIGGAGLVAGGLFAARRGEQHTPVVVISIGTGIASILSAAFVIKHYDVHYTAGVSATLPSGVVAGYLLAKSLNYRFKALERALAAIAILLLAAGTVPALMASLSQSAITTERAKSDLKEIYALTSAIDGAIQFNYKSPFAGYGESFVIYYASIPRLKEEYVAGRPRMAGDVTAEWFNRKVGAYVIDKQYFPTVESVKASPNIIALNEKSVTFELIELRTVFLLIPHEQS